MKNFVAGIFVGFTILAIVFFLFEGAADTQAEREARIMAACDAPLKADVHGCKVMDNCTIDGARFLKTAGVTK